MKLVLLIILPAFLLSACNTMEGMGRDFQSAGKSLEKKAEE